jgi:outer membrane lipoprotein-sorting protein
MQMQFEDKSMSRSTLLTYCFLALSPAIAPAAESTAPPAKLTAAQIVEKNIAVRGGLNEWRAVKTLSWSGKMEAGGNNRAAMPAPVPVASAAPPVPAAERASRSKAALPPPRPNEQVQLPFVLEMERPRKSRLEIVFKGQTAVQVYDGSGGWKLRPFLNRRDVDPYSAEELQAAARQAELDGPIMEAAAAGTRITLAGTEDVEGHAAYKLALTSKDNRVRNVWIDARTFLELKMDGTPRRLDGKYHPVWVYLRDYKTVSGLAMPTVYETTVQGVKATEKINIDNIVVNPKLADARFARPG